MLLGLVRQGSQSPDLRSSTSVATPLKAWLEFQTHERRDRLSCSHPGILDLSPTKLTICDELHETD